MGPLFFLLFTSGTWFIASFHPHNQAQSLRPWSDEKGMDGEISLALGNDREPHQQTNKQTNKPPKTPSARPQTHKCSVSTHVHHDLCWNENFLLPNEPKGRFWGFMEVMDLRIQL